MGLRTLQAGTPASNHTVYENDGIPPPALDGANLLRIGAGGWITGIDIADDGAMVIRTDTYGAYHRSSHTAEWEQLLTKSAMGINGGHEADGDAFSSGDAGVYEICIAHSNSSIIYMEWDGFLFKSTDAGSSFSKTTFAEAALQPNGDFRDRGPRMAIHPTDPNTVIASTPTAIFYTTNGGTTWTACNGVLEPTGLSGTGYVIAFDPSTPTTVYVGINGRGVYRSTTGASGTFSPMSGGPTSMRRIAVGDDGVVMCTDASDSSNLWRFQSSTWTNLGYATTDTGTGSASYWHSVCPDPNNAGHWYIGGDTGNVMAYTADNGASFTPLGNRGTRVATDIPWLAQTQEAYMTNGDMRFDPTQTNVMYFAQGIGVWKCTPPTTNTTFNWTSDSIAIEQLVMTRFRSPPGGSLIATCMDRCVFVLNDPDSYPSAHGPNHTQSIRHGWSCDYASSDPTVIIVNIGSSEFALSTNGGSSWTVKSAPSGASFGGSVAASTATNFVWVGLATNARMYFTTNAGTTWSTATMSGVPTDGYTGWGETLFLRQFAVCADRVTANKFYCINNGRVNDTSFAGIWASTDGGANWTRVYAGRVPWTGLAAATEYSVGSFNFMIDAVPENAGHLFMTAGDVGGSNVGKFYRSQDGGVTLEEIPNVVEVKSFGFGASESGTDYPVVHIYGYVNSVFGVYVSENADEANVNNITWTRIDDGTGFPMGRFDAISNISGDNNVYGLTYIGYNGSGGIYINWGA